MNAPLAQVNRLHCEIVRGLIAQGSCSDNAALARILDESPAAVETLLRELAAIHGVVLHPHVCEPWIVHPFSTTPTLHWIEKDHRGWWAPCVWCAMGVAALVGGEVTIHTRYGGEGEALSIPVRDGEPVAPNEIWVHFAIPPARAWDNVHQHCALVLPFRSPDEIAAWCWRHSVPEGEAVPLAQVARLARAWYGSHADPNWHKWTIAEAQDIFRSTGLTARFWDLQAGRERF